MMKNGYRDSLGRFVKGNPGSSGRPTKYSKELAKEFVERIKIRSTLAVCEDDLDCPCRSVIWEWQEKYPEFRAQCEVSKLIYAENLLEQAQKDVENTNREDVQVAALKLKSATWRAERVLNRRYGSTTKIVGAQDGETPVTLVIKHIGSECQQ
jgi:hypothetical protein